MVREHPSSGRHGPCSSEFQVLAWLGHSTQPSGHTLI